MGLKEDNIILGKIEKAIFASIVPLASIDPMVLLQLLSVSMHFSFSQDISPNIDLRWIHQNPLQITPSQIQKLAHETWTELSGREDISIEVNRFSLPLTSEGLLLLVRQKSMISEKASRYKPGFFPVVFQVGLFGAVEPDGSNQKLSAFEALIKKLNPKAPLIPSGIMDCWIKENYLSFNQSLEFYDEKEVINFFSRIEKWEGWAGQDKNKVTVSSPKKCPNCECYHHHPVFPGFPCWHCGFEPKKET